MNNHRQGTAPNYTNACIVMFGVNILWVLVVVWTVWGLVCAIMLGFGVHLLLERVSIWKAQHDVASIRRGKGL